MSVPRLVHLTTTDMSLDWLLRPQLEAFADAGYEVIGMVRRSSVEPFARIEGIRDRITIVQGDLLDQFSLVEILDQHRPDEIYNLAAQSFVPTSWNQPVLTAEFTALGVTRLLEAIKHVDRNMRFYQASLTSTDLTSPSDRFFTKRTGFDGSFRLRVQDLLADSPQALDWLAPELTLRGGFQSREGQRQLGFMTAGFDQGALTQELDQNVSVARSA